MVHALNLPDIHASLEDIEVEFIKESCRGEFWAREVGQRVSVQTVDHDAHCQEDNQDEDCHNNMDCRVSHGERQRRKNPKAE